MTRIRFGFIYRYNNYYQNCVAYLLLEFNIIQQII